MAPPACSPPWRSPPVTPTGSSWLNLVERFFAEITVKLLRRGVHRSVTALEKDIRGWIESVSPRWVRDRGEGGRSLMKWPSGKVLAMREFAS